MTFAAAQAGERTVTWSGLELTGPDAANYVLADTVATTSADITRRALTASFTASDKTYDGSPAATVALAELAGIAGDDVVTVSGATATFANKHAGTGKTVAVSGYALGGADADSYSINPTATTQASITARPLTVTLTAARKVYDATTAAVTTRSDNRVAGDALTVTSTTPAFTSPGVGSAKLVRATGLALGGADAANYALTSTTASTTAAITKRVLSVRADPKSFRRGEPVPAWTTTFSGFAGDQTESVLRGALRHVVKNSRGATVAITSLSPTGRYKIVPSGLTSANYKVVYASGPLTVAAMAPAVAYQPDALVSLDNGTHLGAGVINATGAGQGVTARVKRGTQRVFFITAVNAGLATDTLRLRGCASGGGQTVSYLANASGTTGITSAATNGTYQASLAPGAGRVVRVVVKVAPTAPLTTRPCAVTLTSSRRPAGVDTVALKVTAIR